MNPACCSDCSLWFVVLSNISRLFNEAYLSSSSEDVRVLGISSIHYDHISAIFSSINIPVCVTLRTIVAFSGKLVTNHTFMHPITYPV